MAAQTISKLLVSLVAGAQGVAPVAAELNRTHATNPLWPGHARFHVVWQVISAVFYGGLTISLLWTDAFPTAPFALVVTLAAAPLIAFLLALVARRLYGGTLSDPNGIPATPIRIAGRVYLVHLNVVLVGVGLALLLVAAALARTT